MVMGYKATATHYLIKLFLAEIPNGSTKLLLEQLRKLKELKSWINRPTVSI